MKFAKPTLVLAAVLAAGAAALPPVLLRGAGEGSPFSEPPSAKPVVTAPATGEKPSQDYEKGIRPILKKYCFDCHGGGEEEGGIVLDDYESATAALKDFKTWDRVHFNIERQMMPPSDRKAQPTYEEREAVMAWIEREVYRLNPQEPDPGRVTIRRLNKVEYSNSIRDLFGADFRPADDFPADDSGYGYDNNGDVLSLSPLMIEKYLKAAEMVVDKALVTKAARAETRDVKGAALKFTGNTNLSGDTAVLSSNGSVTAEVKLEAGRYRILVSAGQDEAGKDPAKMVFLINGKSVETYDVKTPPDKPSVFQVEKSLPAGTLKLEVQFTNDFFDEKAPAGKRDRNLHLLGFRVEGPMEKLVPPPLTPTHRRVFVETPKGVSDEKATAGRLLYRFVSRAWRRPVSDAELNRLMALYELGRKQGETFEGGVALGIKAALVSPNFLFRGEVQPEPNNPAKVFAVDEYALAARLSYFIWSSIPDEELLSHAYKKILRKNLRAQVERMLADPRASALSENFLGQWLQLRNLETANPDAAFVKGFDQDLRDSMREETERLFERLLKENRPFTELLTADYTFVNEKLAGHYGLANVKGAEFRQVSLKDTPRRGVLGHAGILTITSHPNRTSIVKRGKWVLENLLGTPPPPAPPQVPPLEEGEKIAKTASLRERFEKHRSDPACFGCHSRMDGIGFGMENFDLVGRWRTSDYGHPVDSGGQLGSGEKFQNAQELIGILAGSKRHLLHENFAENLLTYSLGRGLEYYDKPAVKELVTKAEKEGGGVRSFIFAVVESVPFQYRRGDGRR